MPFAELSVTSNFTFLTGAPHPEEMMRRAADLGLPALAIADDNSVAGIVRAHVEAREIARRGGAAPPPDPCRPDRDAQQAGGGRQRQSGCCTFFPARSCRCLPCFTHAGCRTVKQCLNAEVSRVKSRPYDLADGIACDRLPPRNGPVRMTNADPAPHRRSDSRRSACCRPRKDRGCLHRSSAPLR